jgi:hypothetical protein
MGAGAQMAAERDRWPEHWRVADLEFEEDGLLDLLAPEEELVAVVPGMRRTPADGENQVLIAVTSQRVVVVGRSAVESADLRVVDVTHCSSTVPRLTHQVPHFGGQLMVDLDEESIARMWSRIDDVTGLTGSLNE